MPKFFNNYTGPSQQQQEEAFRNGGADAPGGHNAWAKVNGGADAAAFDDWVGHYNSAPDWQKGYAYDESGQWKSYYDPDQKPTSQGNKAPTPSGTPAPKGGGGGGGAAAPAAAAPAMAGLNLAGGGGGAMVGGGGGAKIDPEPNASAMSSPMISGLAAAGAGGGAEGYINSQAPGLRQGLGNRIIPDGSAPLAGLARRIY